MKGAQSCRPLSAVAPWAAALAQEQDVIRTASMAGMQVSYIFLGGGTSSHMVGVKAPKCLGDKFS